MGDNELVIKISGDIKDLKKSFEDAKSQTDSLGSTLATMAEISGVAFAALTAQVGLSLSAFSDSEKASGALTLALQNQGIYTDALKESYAQYADQVSEATGISKTQITASQAVAQSFLGQMPVTKELTQAIADLAVKQGTTLPAAAEELGRAIGSGTGMLVRQIPALASASTEAERYKLVMDFVAQKAAGLATAANQASFGVIGLKTAFEESQVQLGQRFAPAFTAIVGTITNFIKPAKDATGTVTDLKAAFLAAGLVITGLGVALPLLAQGFLAVRAAMIALEVGAAPLLAVGAIIAGLVVAVVELGLHWKTASETVKNVVSGLVTFVSGAFKGLGTVLAGAFTLDPEKIKEGLDAIQKAFADSVAKATTALPQQTEKALTEQDAIKKKFADKAAAELKQQEADKLAFRRAENELLVLEQEHASAQLIAAKGAEVKTLQAIVAKGKSAERDALRASLKDEQAITAQEQTRELERDKEFAQISLQTKKTLDARYTEYKTQLDEDEKSRLRASIETEEQADKKAYADELQLEIQAHNRFLDEERKYGIAYATISKAVNSQEVQGFKSATSELTALSQSKNKTLQDIGKAAAVAEIPVKTAQSAMNVFAGFSTIPFIGPALGFAAAAAVIAFGAEQLGTALAANQGGVVPGIGSTDSVPALLTPGELVVPKQNFNQVVGAVAAQQNSGGQAQTSSSVEVHMHLTKDLGSLIETKIIERQRSGTSLLPRFT